MVEFLFETVYILLGAALVAGIVHIIVIEKKTRAADAKLHEARLAAYKIEPLQATAPLGKKTPVKRKAPVKRVAAKKAAPKKVAAKKTAK